MLFSEPLPFEEALQSREVKRLLPTELSSRELARLPAELRERAMFSARTANAGYLQDINDWTKDLVDGNLDQATMRLRMKEKLQALGYQPDPEKRGGIEDLSSDRRLNLIIETNAEQARGYGYWMQGQDPAVLEAFPAQELYRAEERMIPRDWIGRWSEAGGQFYDGRMIALKDDPIWIEISAFGTPYPPFDFNSGMDVRDVSRSEAIDLGVISPEDPPPVPQERGFNDDLQSGSAGDLTPDLQDALLESLGAGFRFLAGVLTKATA
jgi:hypothetical protein